jgi:hypothetical protein
LAICVEIMPHAKDEPHRRVAVVIVSELNADPFDTVHERRVGDDLLGFFLFELALLVGDCHGMNYRLPVT